MVRISCFSTPPVNNSKNVAQRSIGTLQADYQSAIQDQSVKLVKGSVKSNPMLDKFNSSCNSVKRSPSPYSLQDCLRSEDLNINLTEDNQETLQTVLIQKGRSLGSIMEKESGYCGDDITEADDIDHGFLFDSLNGWNLKEDPESSDNVNSTEVFNHENDLIKSFDVLSDSKHHEALLSIEVLKQPYRDWRANFAEKAVDDIVDSGYSLEHIPILSRSYSMANIRLNKNVSSKNDPSHGHIFRRSRSFSDLKKLNILETELQNGEKYFDFRGVVEKSIISSCSDFPLHHDVFQKVPCFDDMEEGLCLVRRKKFHDSNGKCLRLKLDMNSKEACKSQFNINFADVLGKFDANDAKFTRECQRESSRYNWDQLNPQEFSMRRVENWLSQIVIRSDLIVENQGESSTTVSMEEPHIVSVVDSPKPDTRSNLAMEVAYNYISSLTSSSSSAQMTNLGLVIVPNLSPFGNLQVLNFSGNAIVHITSGCLPKGLHMLNLSKNNISTIEGLRNLSHLRVLNLNYNRITRIGHGLASCSSLTELYLVGNKISEVEGLHRLLKLSIIDLRFNKISTSKGLGQLAANYRSLQAINLEGNPAQKNAGDEQLKKFLLGLLPNLIYYNKQAIRIGSKEVSDRASRAVASPQFDKSFRVEHKLWQRGSHGSELDQLPHNHGQQNHPIQTPSRKPSKDRHVRLQLPPASKLAKQRSDTGKKPLGSNTKDAMKRSQSTDALRGFLKL